MLLNERLIWSCRGERDLSGIKIMVEEGLVDSVRDCFIGELDQLILRTKEKVIKKNVFSDKELEYEDYLKEVFFNPLNKIERIEGGIICHLSELVIQHIDHGNYPLEYYNITRVLNGVKKQYPQAVIEGYIGYAHSDEGSGEVKQYEIVTDKTIIKKVYKDETNKTYDFVGKKIDSFMEEWEELFWERFEEETSEEDYDQISYNLLAYSEWISEKHLKTYVKDFLEADPENYMACLEESAQKYKH